MNDGWKYAIIYDDKPRPSFWRHPIKWMKWRKEAQEIIAYLYEFTIDFTDNPDGLTIIWGDPYELDTEQRGHEDSDKESS